MMFGVTGIIISFMVFTMQENRPEHPDTHDDKENDTKDHGDVDQPVDAVSV
jgi:hypothetical protein